MTAIVKSGRLASLCGLLIIWPLMELWDVPGYADRLEDEMISDYVSKRQAVGDPRDAQAIEVECNYV